jgi:hypothetical protein
MARRYKYGKPWSELSRFERAQIRGPREYAPRTIERFQRRAARGVARREALLSAINETRAALIAISRAYDRERAAIDARRVRGEYAIEEKRRADAERRLKEIRDRERRAEERPSETPPQYERHPGSITIYTGEYNRETVEYLLQQLKRRGVTLAYINVRSDNERLDRSVYKTGHFMRTGIAKHWTEEQISAELRRWAVIGESHVYEITVPLVDAQSARSLKKRRPVNVNFDPASLSVKPFDVERHKAREAIKLQRRKEREEREAKSNAQRERRHRRADQQLAEKYVSIERPLLERLEFFERELELIRDVLAELSYKLGE